MRFVTIATHVESYFPCLEESCRRHDCDLLVLGLGSKWGGYPWKMELIYQYLVTEAAKNPQEILVFIDAFDTCILQSAAVIEARFRAIGKSILFSIEAPYTNLLFRYLYWKTYRYKYQGHNICAGLYMGYAGALKALFESLRADPEIMKFNDDQRMLAEFLHRHPESGSVAAALDTTSSIFLNIHGGTKYWPSYQYFNMDANPYFQIRDRKLITHGGVEPCIIHGPGGTNMNALLDKLGYARFILNQDPLDRTRYNIRCILHFAFFVKMEIGIVIILSLSLLFWLL